MQQFLSCLSGSALSTSATQYLPVCGFPPNGAEAAEGDTNSVVSTGGVIDNLLVNVRTAPGAAKSYTFALMVNGSATALTCAVSGGAATTASDLTNSVAVSAGDIISIRSVPSGTPTADSNGVTCAVRFTGSTANESLILGGVGIAALQKLTAAGGTQYLPFGGGHDINFNTTEGDAVFVVPTGGTLKNLFINLVTATGAAKTWAFTVMLNGVAQTLAVSITDGSTGNDTSHTVAVVAGDTISLRAVPTSTPASTNVRFGMTFVATTNGQSIVVGSKPGSSPSSATLTTYTPATTDADSSTTETGYRSVYGAATFSKLYYKFTTAPGSGKSFTITARKNAADTALTCAVSGTGNTGNDTSNSFTTVSGDDVDFKIVPASTPTLSAQHFGMVQFITPPSGPVNMKTADDLAKASVKTMNGLAIASVKTVNGLA